LTQRASVQAERNNKLFENQLTKAAASLDPNFGVGKRSSPSHCLPWSIDHLGLEL